MLKCEEHTEKYLHSLGSWNSVWVLTQENNIMESIVEGLLFKENNKEKTHYIK